MNKNNKQALKWDNWSRLLCILLMSAIILSVVSYYGKRTRFSAKLETVADMQVAEYLQCEKVWDKVLHVRGKLIASKLNPNHFVINECLEIVSPLKNSVCEDFIESENYKRSLLLIIVSSARSHFVERQLIRDSWGSIKNYSIGSGWEVRTVFLLGQSDYCLSSKKEKYSDLWNKTREEDVQIEKEQENYKDLVIGSFTDTYRNNTYKHLTGLKYMLEKCSKADFILKTDDDVFVNIPLILEKKSEEIKLGDKENSDIYCKSPVHNQPIRCKNCPSRKWYTTREEWPGDSYPLFCIGQLILMTRSWVEKLYEVRNLQRFHWIDDLFVSGLLREVAEKEFGVKAQIKSVASFMKPMEPRLLCRNVSKANVYERQRNLTIFHHIRRNGDFVRLMKCLSDISLGTNLPFSSY